MDEQFELLSGEPAFGDVDEPFSLAGVPGHAGERETGALPHVVVVDLGDRACDAVRRCAFTDRRCIRFSFSEWLVGKKSSNE